MADIDILRQAIDSGMIDITTIRMQVEEMERKEYLGQHNRKIWQGNDGWWCTYVYVEGKRKFIKKNSKELVEQAVIQHLKEPTLPTFQSVFSKALLEKLKHKEIGQGTYDRYKVDFNKYFSDISKTKFNDINEYWLEEMIKTKVADLNLNSKQFGNMKILIKIIFKYAKRENISNISITSFLGDLEISSKAFSRPKKKKQVFYESEIPKVVDYLLSKDNVTYLGIAFDFFTGLRAGELSAIKFSDFEGNKLHIQRQEIRYKNDDGIFEYEVVDYTKTVAGDRVMFVTDKALEIIARIKKINGSNEYVFMNGDNRIHACTFNHYLETACKKLDLEKLSMHKIRKTYGTTLIDSGVDDSLIMLQMGHSDINTTRQYYYYSNKDDCKKMEQINNAIKFG